MPYYHIRVKRVRGRPPIVYEFDFSKKDLETLLKQTKKDNELFLYSSFESIREQDIEDIDVARTSKKSSHYGIGRLKGVSIFEKGKIVTSEFIKKPLSRKAKKKTAFPNAKPKQEILSKNIFIVHGRDHKPMKELKAMLKEFGLNPIVLHEQPSASRTIVEKLEKYSDVVGYAFVILTSDEVGCLKKEYLRLYEISLSEAGESEDERKEKTDFFFQNIIRMLINRARQNVILEFGLFMGLLGRDRVCCLHKGNVELPSNMQGIVYIPFKDSVEETRDMIIKELKEAGYEIKM